MHYDIAGAFGVERSTLISNSDKVVVDVIRRGDSAPLGQLFFRDGHVVLRVSAEPTLESSHVMFYEEEDE